MSEPVVEPEAALVEPEGPTGEVRPFAAWLQEFRGGALHQELSFLLQQAATAVRDHRKPATITLQIRLETTKVSDAAFEVSDKVTVKLPEPSRESALYFADAEGNLIRDNPNQPALPGIVRVVQTTPTQPARKVNQ